MLKPETPLQVVAEYIEGALLMVATVPAAFVLFLLVWSLVRAVHHV